MSDIATTARENASHCEAKKHALRQTQDGIVVAFVLHPNDVPAALQLAPLGTRYMLALVEIGEDETPIERKEARTQTVQSNPKSQPAPNPTPARAPARNYAQMAAIVGSKPAFWLFARERGNNAVKDAASAADYIRSVCGVTSRSEIEHESKAGNRWLILHSAFLAWDDAVRVGAA
jgi:hypothetical protein